MLVEKYPVVQSEDSLDLWPTTRNPFFKSRECMKGGPYHSPGERGVPSRYGEMGVIGRPVLLEGAVGRRPEQSGLLFSLPTLLFPRP